MHSVHKRKKENAPYIYVLGLLEIFTSIFLCMALISYSPHDQSWFFYTTHPQPIHNWAGIIGAYTAALIIYVAGISSFYGIALLAWIGILRIRSISFATECDRLLALGFLIGVQAMLCAWYSIDFFAGATPGGLLGTTLLSSATTLFGRYGTLLLLHLSLFIGWIIVLRFSFIKIMQATFSFVTKRSVWQKLGYYTYKLLYYISIPVRKSAHFIKQLWDSSIVPEQSYKAADFETILRQTEQEVLDAEYWTARKEPVQPSMPAPVLSEAKEMPAVISKTASIYQLPTLPEIAKSTKADSRIAQELEARAATLEEKLKHFGVQGKVVSIRRGPVVTLFEYQPTIDTKVSKIIALEDDLALALQALSIRIIAPIPGRSVVGFEVANQERVDVLLAHSMRDPLYTADTYSLPLIIGQDTTGNTVIVDLARMPHLLIAGSTGSGKSVALNTMLISLLCKKTPDDLKVILIDPKRLEFSMYADTAHLLFPIITDPRKALLALRWLANHMDERYTRMSQVGAKNIRDYRALCQATPGAHEQLPYIVVIIDELADLMMTASKEVEDLIVRIVQMARAAGIHMIVATQRPSVDVITGLIKVNFPSRLACRVTSKTDSRTILDCNGADKLLGRGDMLFLDSAGALRRVHGAYVSDQEIQQVVQQIKNQVSASYYDELLIQTGTELTPESDDKLYNEVLQFVTSVDEISISLLQRKFRIGFNRSARIIERLETQGIILADGSKTRKVIR